MDTYPPALLQAQVAPRIQRPAQSRTPPSTHFAHKYTLSACLIIGFRKKNRTYTACLKRVGQCVPEICPAVLAFRAI